MSEIVVINENIPQQIKVFTKWVSIHLSKNKSNVKIKDVTKDLSNGIALVELAEILINKLAPRNWELAPKQTADMIHNCDLALEMFSNDGVYLVGITGKDINENNEPVILDLIWTLILHYSIGKYEIDFDTLMQWAIDRTSHYDHVEDFKPYHLSMLALLDSYHPDKINYSTINPEDVEGDSQNTVQSLKNLKIPVILDSSDYQLSEIDEKCLLAQLALAKVNLEKLRLTRSAISTPTKPPHGTPIIVQTREIELHIEEEEEEQLEARKIDFEEEEEETAETVETEETIELRVIDRNVDLPEPIFSPYKVEGDNKQFAGKKFSLIMTLKKSCFECNDGDGEVTLALSLVNDKEPYMNPSGRMLDLRRPNIQTDKNQQFTFGVDEWTTVIDSFSNPGMVWDVCDRDNLNPPPGTVFYLFPFHGRHNQHFIYRDSMIYAQQNGHVVTYVGGEKPLVMMEPSREMKERQTFVIQVLE